MSENIFGDTQQPSAQPDVEDPDFNLGPIGDSPALAYAPPPAAFYPSDGEPPVDAHSDAPAPTSNHRLFITLSLVLGVLIVAAVMVIVTIVRSRNSRPAPMAPKTTATAPRPTITVTPLPTATAMAVPTLVAMQITVDGPSQYQANGNNGLPYLVEYNLSLARGDPTTVTVSCPKCLWPALSQGEIQLVPGVLSAFQVGATGGDELALAILVNGSTECLQWKLSPGDRDEPFRGICVPTSP
jgi:hypothetical protein